MLRVLGILYLLRMNGTIANGASLTIGETTLQHGQGGPGQQAAHKVLLSFKVNGVSLDQLTQNNALKMFIIFLSAETSILNRYANEADSDIENAGGRTAVLALAKELLERDCEGSWQGLKAALLPCWEKLKILYLRIGGQCRTQAWVDFQNEHRNYGIRAGLPGQPKLADADRLRKAALMKLMILDEYLDIAQGMTFPLLDAELQNMFEAAFDADLAALMARTSASASSSSVVTAGHSCAHCGKPTNLCCSRCKAVYYCSKECQKARWKSHKPSCHPPRP
ncbi:zinc finger MYND domain-containing protein [Pseudomonas gingeri]|uniref:Zinc finger MYND domain-containing protein n=1 Tax=Pseudomonas gingeri TaxID=117681 RepID=A0A7Y8C5P1_9PSED|nr:zinc finger MYND domain-containing protein [Pseudomonas gingeri]NWB99482.1 zinc finger MYND domain-containing protein [Pseudomonas gingeri]